MWDCLTYLNPWDGSDIWLLRSKIGLINQDLTGLADLDREMVWSVTQYKNKNKNKNPILVSTHYNLDVHKYIYTTSLLALLHNNTKLKFINGKIHFHFFTHHLFLVTTIRVLEWRSGGGRRRRYWLVVRCHTSSGNLQVLHGARRLQ